jgi:Ca2+-binding EF-hand superfamily protein
MISRRRTIVVTIGGLIGAVTPTLAQTKKKPSLITRLDTDNDGTVDIAEAKKAGAEVFDKLDTDKDGTLTMTELHGRLSRKEFAAADGDADKTLSKDEYLAVVERRFKSADADGDGTVSAAEFGTPAGRALASLLN